MKRFYFGGWKQKQQSFIVYRNNSGTVVGSHWNSVMCWWPPLLLNCCTDVHIQYCVPSLCLVGLVLIPSLQSCFYLSMWSCGGFSGNIFGWCLSLIWVIESYRCYCQCSYCLALEEELSVCFAEGGQAAFSKSCSPELFEAYSEVLDWSTMSSAQ